MTKISRNKYKNGNYLIQYLLCIIFKLIHIRYTAHARLQLTFLKHGF